MNILRIVSVVCLSSFCFGQSTRTVQVADLSPADCPVQVSGQTQHFESVNNGRLSASFADKISATNLSKNTIIAMVVNVVYSTSYSPLLQETKELDTFFSHDLEILPGHTYVHEHMKSKGTFTMDVSPGAGPSTPHVESNVIWVQFADGSTWGDSKNPQVQDVLKKREILHQRLKNLQDAANRGDEDFARALAVNSGNPDVDFVIDRIRAHEKKDGTVVAVRKVREMLDVASTRGDLKAQ